MTGHTKTPWEFVPAQAGRISWNAFIRAPKEGDMPYALEVAGGDYTGYGGNERRTADLQFIVKAANVHDDLVAALEAVEADAESDANADEDRAPQITHETLAMIRAALAKATG